MAIGDAYATADEYKARLEKSSSAEDSEIESDLIAASRYIDKKLDRKSGFNQDEADTFRIYMPKSSGRRVLQDWAESENPYLYGGLSRVLDIEDVVSITSVTVDEAKNDTFSRTLTSSDYELLPRNADKGPEAKPFHRIELTSWGTMFGFTPGARVKVTGIHGWPAVPAAIKLATIEIAGILRRESSLATTRVLEVDEVIESSPQARAILNSLMTNYGRGISF